MSDSKQPMVDLDEDNFEEFEDAVPTAMPALVKAVSVTQAQLDAAEERKKWDDDDIDDLFPAMLRTEINAGTAPFITPVGMPVTAKLQKTRARREAELSRREQALAKAENALTQRKKAVDGVVDALRNPDGKAVRPINDTVKHPDRAVGKMLVELQKAEANPEIDGEAKYAVAATAEYTAWLEDAKRNKTFSSLDLQERETRVMEREKLLAAQEEQLNESRKKLVRARRASILKILPENSTEAVIVAKEEEETAKVVQVRQRARRRASITAVREQAEGKGLSVDATKQLIIKAALSVAQAEEVEDTEILGEEDADDTVAVAASKGFTPYVPQAGNKVDEAVGATVNEAKLAVGLRLLQGKKSKNARNRNDYKLSNGKVIFVRVVHEVVVGALKSGEANVTWLPLLALLKAIM